MIERLIRTVGIKGRLFRKQILGVLIFPV